MDWDLVFELEAKQHFSLNLRRQHKRLDYYALLCEGVVVTVD
jgi:hypothetical protein